MYSCYIAPRRKIAHTRATVNSFWLFSVVGVGIATGCGLDSLESIPGRGKAFSVYHNVQTGSGAHPSTYSVGIRVLFRGGKAAGFVELTTLPHLEVKNGGAVSSFPHTSSMHIV
jgi:hypothetical protein